MSEEKSGASFLNKLLGRKASVEAAPESRVDEVAREPRTWLQRLRSGLSRSSSQLGQNLSALIRKRKLDDETLQDLEDILIQADLGLETAVRITERLAEDRRELSAQLAEASAALKAQAPEGIARLEQIEAQLAEQASVDPAPAQRSDAEIEAEARDLMEALAGAETQLAEAANAHAQTREALAQLRARIEQRRERIASARAELGDAEACTSQRKQRADALARAEQDRNAAVRDSAAWREAAPDADRFAALEAAAWRERTSPYTASRWPTSRALSPPSAPMVAGSTCACSCCWDRDYWQESERWQRNASRGARVSWR